MTGHHHPGFMTGLALLIPITLSTMAIVLLAPILPGLLGEFAGVPGHDYWVPMILTVPALCVALLSPLAGVLGDWFGRRRLLIGALVAYSAVGVAPVFLTGLVPIIISRIGVGMAEALIMVLTTTMIGDYYQGAARDRWLAGQTAAASLSALVFFNVGGQLGRFGWRAPFWVYASALVMLAMVLVFTWEPSQADPDEEADRVPHHGTWAGFPWARLIGIIAITVYGSVLFYTVQIQAGRGLAALGMTDPGSIGLFTSIASIGVPLGTLVYARVGRMRVARLLMIEFAALTVGFAMMSRAEHVTPFLIGCFINQFGAGMLLPTLLVWAMDGLQFDIRARAAGMWTAAFSIGQFLCPVVVTFASDHLGGLNGALGALSVAGGIATVAALAGNLRKGVRPAAAGVVLHG